MAKRLREHVNYTLKELEQYAQTEGSCVRKVNTKLHLSMGPFCLADFKHILMAHIVRSKVGFYDVHLDGIVLDVKKVKVLGTTGAMRADDPRIHINVNADIYVFKPTEGAELSGVVKHIGAHHVGVVLYRVFNANLRVCHKVDKEEVQMDQTVKFRIRNYNLQNVFPYIDGELLTESGGAVTPKGKLEFKDSDNVDSGIEEKEGIQDLDELLTIIKIEEPDDYESTHSVKKSPTRSKKHSESMESNDSGTTVKKSKKKRKTSSNSCDSGPPMTPKKVKNEPDYSADEQTQVAIKKPKKEKSSKTKSNASPAKSVKIKQEEFYTDDD